MFTPWKCGDCGAHGKIRHEPQHTAADISRWTMQQHAMKAPACHKAAMERLVKEARESAQLSPRDRHIIVTARIKRKIMADALRVQRKADREAAAAAAKDHRPEYRAALLSKTRKEWLAGKVGRKGYAFT